MYKKTNNVDISVDFSKIDSNALQCDETLQVANNTKVQQGVYEFNDLLE